MAVDWAQTNVFASLSKCLQNQRIHHDTSRVCIEMSRKVEYKKANMQVKAASREALRLPTQFLTAPKKLTAKLCQNVELGVFLPEMHIEEELTL